MTRRGSGHGRDDLNSPGQSASTNLRAMDRGLREKQGSLVAHVAASQALEANFGLLQPAETRRAERFRRQQDEQDYLAARALAKLVITELTGAPSPAIRLRQRCDTCGSESHGRPRAYLTDQELHVSWSHSRGRVAASAAWESVAIDIEHIQRNRIIPTALSPRERAVVDHAPDPGVEFARIWTCKESLVKIGAITIDSFSAVDLTANAARWQQWHLRSWVDYEAGFVVTVASENEAALASASLRTGSSGFAQF
jgi:4'-phosphopantetheinyl transferase